MPPCVAAPSDVRQAYKQFLGAVVELLNGEVVSEELQEVAPAVYALFAGDDTQSNLADNVLRRR